MSKAIPSINYNLPVNGFVKLSSMVLIFCAYLSFNSFYTEIIGSGISIYGGLYHITNTSQSIEIILFIIGSFILISFPNLQEINLNYLKKNLNKINLSSTTQSLDDSTVKNITTNNSIAYNSSTIRNSYNSESRNIIENVDYPLTKENSINYSLIIIFNLIGASLLLSSYDLISMYLSIELQSFAVYVLSTMNRNSESSTSAGLKYFLLGGLSSCFILLGAGLVYSLTGLTNFESIYMFISSAEINSIIQGFYLGIIFIFIGFLFKVSAAPLHNWAPDVYNDTPTLVTIWITIMPKISILLLLLEIYTGFISTNNIFSIENTLININSIIKNLLLVSSLLSLIIGSLVGLAQIKIKRLLAYSTISHIGFILLALAINTEISIDSFLFYIIQYSLTNLNIFLIIIGLSYIMNYSYSYLKLNLKNLSIKDIKNISELKNQFFENPLLTLCFSICLFSMAGIPPLIGFFAKQFVLYSSLQSGYNFISIVAILVSVISASYYLKIVKVLYNESKNSNALTQSLTRNETINSFELLRFTQLSNVYNVIISFVLILNKITVISPLNKNINLINNKELQLEEKTLTFNNLIISNSHSFLISTLTLTILLFILKPSLILNSTQLLSLSLFNF